MSRSALFQETRVSVAQNRSFFGFFLQIFLVGMTFKFISLRYINEHVYFPPFFSGFSTPDLVENSLRIETWLNRKTYTGKWVSMKKLWNPFVTKIRIEVTIFSTVTVFLRNENNFSSLAILLSILLFPVVRIFDAVSQDSLISLARTFSSCLLSEKTLKREGEERRRKNIESESSARWSEVENVSLFVGNTIARI